MCVLRTLRLMAAMLCWLGVALGQTSMEFARQLHTESQTLSDQFLTALGKLEDELAKQGDYQGAEMVKLRRSEISIMGRVLAAGVAEASPEAATQTVDPEAFAKLDEALSLRLRQVLNPLFDSRLKALQGLDAGEPSSKGWVEAQSRHLRELKEELQAEGLAVLGRMINHWSEPVSGQVFKSVRWSAEGEDAAHFTVKLGQRDQLLELAWVQCPAAGVPSAGTEFSRGLGLSPEIEASLNEAAARWMQDHVSAQDLRIVLLQPQEGTGHARCLVQVMGLGWLQEALVLRGLAVVTPLEDSESEDLLLRAWHQSLTRAQEISRTARRGVWSMIEPKKEASP